MAGTEDGHQAQKLDAAFWGSQLDEWLMPVWWDVDVMDFSASAGATTVFAHTDSREFRAGADQWAVIFSENWSSYEAVLIDSISGNTLTLDSGLANDWPVGSRIYPARVVRFAPSTQVSRITAGVVDWSLRAEVVDREAWTSSQDADGDGTAVTYRSLPVFDVEPNRSEPVSANYQRLSSRLDFQVGGFDIVDHGGRAFVGRPQDHTLTDRAEVWAMRQWLEHLAGRYSAFWCSTHQSDITVQSDIGSTDTSIDVDRLNYDDEYADQLGRRDIAIKLKDGTVYCRRITGATIVDADTEELAIDSALGSAVSASDIAKVSWLEQVRLGADSLQIEHLTAEVAQISLPLRTLR